MLTIFRLASSHSHAHLSTPLLPRHLPLPITCCFDMINYRTFYSLTFRSVMRRRPRRTFTFVFIFVPSLFPLSLSFLNPSLRCAPAVSSTLSSFVVTYTTAPYVFFSLSSLCSLDSSHTSSLQADLILLIGSYISYPISVLSLSDLFGSPITDVV